MSILATQNVTMNNHVKGITPEVSMKSDGTLVTVHSQKKVRWHTGDIGMCMQIFNADQNLSSFYSVLGTSRDRQGKEFIAAIEGKK